MNTENRPRLVCFDPPEPSVVINPPAADDAAAAQAAALASPDGKITQIQLNSILKAERLKEQAKTERIQKTLEETLTSKNLTVAEREALQTQLDTMKNESRTKDERAAAAIAEAKKSAEAEKARANQFQQKFYDAQVRQEITQSAITEGAFLAPQLVDYLTPKTKMVPVQGPDGKFTGDQMPVTTVTVLESQGAGQPMKEVVKEVSPGEAVKLLKTSPSLYGNFFKSGVVSGIGLGSGAGTSIGGKLDVRSLSPQQYNEIRAKNPELLGLRKNHNRR